MNPNTIPVLLALAFASAVPALGFGGDSDAALLATPGNRVLTPIPQGLNDDDDDDTAPRPARFKAPTAISRSQLRELTEQTDHYYFSKHLGAGCAIGATVLMIGGMAMMISESSTSDETAADGSTKSEATTVGYVGAGMFLAAVPVGVLGGVEIVIAVVRGIKLRHYEREIGYQFSLVPVYDPRTHTSGALARVEF
jgi:hypothetical protein